MDALVVTMTMIVAMSVAHATMYGPQASFFVAGDAADRRLRQIGGRLAWLVIAFDMRVIGTRRGPRAGAGDADACTRCPS